MNEMCNEFFIDCDGIPLHAKLDCPEGNGKAPLCILIHGFTGNMEEEHLKAVQKALNKLGIYVLRAEMYGHGKSGGEFKNHTLFKWITNALAVISYAKQLDFVTDLYLCGHSQGGLLTMLTGAMCADDLKAIIPLSPAWMIPEGTRKGTLLGLSIDPQHIPEMIKCDGWELSGDYVRTAQMIHAEDAIERYKGPVLIVHGDRDETVPFSYAQKAAQLYSNAELVNISGADHCFNGFTGELAAAVSDFFSKMITGGK